MAVRALSEGSEFEDQNRDLLLIRTQQIEKRTLQQRRIQKPGIIRPRARAVTRMRGEALHRDLFGNLERVAQGFRRGAEQALPICRRGELVKREIPANDRKCFGVFAQALRRETLRREPPARQVPVARVNLSQPAFVLPGAGPDQDAPVREFRELTPQPLPVERWGFVEER